jgi:hypothetical protein
MARVRSTARLIADDEAIEETTKSPTEEIPQKKRRIRRIM